MANIIISKRDSTGKKACRKMRYTGHIPGIIYGQKKDCIAITLPVENLLPFLNEKVIKVTLDNLQENVMIQEVQYDSLGDKILHVDFLRIDMTKKINISVPIQFLGVPKGLQQGGVLEKNLTKLNITCLPGDAPKGIPVSIDQMELDAVLRVKDITMPAPSITIHMDGESIIASVRKVRVEEEAKKPEEGEEAAPVEAKEGEPELIRKQKEKPAEEEA